MQQSHQRGKRSLMYWIVFLIVSIAIGGYWYTQVAYPYNPPVNINAFGNQTTPGYIHVVTQNGQKVVQNIKDNFQIGVPDGWKIHTKNGDITIGNNNTNIITDGIEGGCRVVASHTQITNLDSYAKQYCDSDPDCKYYKKEKTTNPSVISLTFFGSFVESGDPSYYLEQVNTDFIVLGIHCENATMKQQELPKILSSFSRIK